MDPSVLFSGVNTSFDYATKTDVPQDQKTSFVTGVFHECFQVKGPYVLKVQKVRVASQQHGQIHTLFS